MKGKIENITREIFYIVLLAGIAFAFNYLSYRVEKYVLYVIAFLGILLIETWFITAFSRYSSRKISQYSEVLQRISVRERFFSYFISPAILYSVTLLFLYYTHTLAADIMVILVTCFLLLILFVNVKSSFKKVYSLENITRIVFDFINIATFYLGCSVLMKIGLDIRIVYLLTGVWSLLLLLDNLILHEKLDSAGLIIAFLCSSFIVLATFASKDFGFFIMPAISTVAFYLIISLWNLRFSGRIRPSDYISPFIFSIFATLVILYL